MISSNDFRPGVSIELDGSVWRVVEFLHVKPGKGGAFVRSTLKNLRTGRVLENTFRAGEKVEIVRVERRKYQYLYSDGDSLVCMDNETYEQINISKELISDGIKFLKESEQVEVLLNGSDIISVEIPIFINLKVIETEPGFKGDTATGAVKAAKLETGAQINVPLFINEGDMLKVDTRTGEYSERVKS